MTKKSMLEKKLRHFPRWRILRKEENHNTLNKYCKIMNYALEIGFFYKEAKDYAIGLLRLRK